MKKKSSAPSIRKDMPILEIVTLIPEVKNVLAEYGLHCFSCVGSQYELLADGCKTHGFTDEDIDELVSDLNDMLKRMPARPETLTVTLEGARAIGKVAAEEGRQGQFLEVIADASGGFCMEFRSEPEPGTGPDGKVFWNTEEPSIRILASALTLKRIGGAIIDFREGRFKLDVPPEAAPSGPEDAEKSGCSCEDSGGCACMEKAHTEAK